MLSEKELQKMIFKDDEALPILINIGLIVVGAPIVSWLTVGTAGCGSDVQAYQPQLLHIILLVAIQPLIFGFARAVRDFGRRRGSAR